MDDILIKILVCFIAGAGAGIGTGFAGMSAAAVIGPMLTTLLGYPMHLAVGTSVFIMAFTALTGGISHFMIGRFPDILCLVLCVVFTLLWARIAAKMPTSLTQRP